MSKKTVIIDAANIIHDDRGAEIYGDDGESVTQMFPERLVSCIEVCKGKGWNVIALLKRLTYLFGKKQFNIGAEGFEQFGVIDQYLRQGSIVLVEHNSDDLFIIEHALNKDGMIISRDWFNDHRESKTDLNWTDIDSRRIYEYEFINHVFTCPSLPTLEKSGTTHVENEPQTNLMERLTSLEQELAAAMEKIRQNERKLVELDLEKISSAEIAKLQSEAKVDKARSSSVVSCAERYAAQLKKAHKKKGAVPSSVKAMCADITSKGLASNRGAMAVVEELKKMKIIHINRQKVEYRF